MIFQIVREDYNKQLENYNLKFKMQQKKWNLLQNKKLLDYKIYKEQKIK